MREQENKSVDVDYKPNLTTWGLFNLSLSHYYFFIQQMFYAPIIFQFVHKILDLQ